MILNFIKTYILFVTICYAWRRDAEKDAAMDRVFIIIIVSAHRVRLIAYICSRIVRTRYAESLV